jgi:hypothetical protein
VNAKTNEFWSVILKVEYNVYLISEEMRIQLHQTRRSLFIVIKIKE